MFDKIDFSGYEDVFFSMYQTTGGDIDNDGDTDIFISAVSKENKNKESEVYLQNSLGNFILERGFISNSPGQVHPRKSIVGDFSSQRGTQGAHWWPLGALRGPSGPKSEETGAATQKT